MEKVGIHGKTRTFLKGLNQEGFGLPFKVIDAYVEHQLLLFIPREIMWVVIPFCPEAWPSVSVASTQTCLLSSAVTSESPTLSDWL